MVDISGEVGSLFTGVKAFGLQTVGLVAWFFIVVILAITVGVITFMVVRRKRYNIKLIIFEKVNGKYQPTRKDVAIEMKYSYDGTTVFYLRKHKKILPRGTIQTGARIYWYKIRDDGEWENVDPYGFVEDADSDHQNLLHKDMRLARASIQKGHRERFEKKQSWLAQNWTIVLGVAFIAMLGIMVFLLFDKFIDVSNSINGAIQATGTVLERTEVIIARMDTICQGGTGYLPA